MKRREILSLGTVCYAELWIHTHYETGEPSQIEVFRWNGLVQQLLPLEETPISLLHYMIEGFPREQPISVKVTFDVEDNNTDEPPDYQWYVTGIEEHNEESRRFSELELKEIGV